MTSAAIASKMIGKSTDESREEFGIEHDLTEEELAKINEENKWADEAI